MDLIRWNKKGIEECAPVSLVGWVVSDHDTIDNNLWSGRDSYGSSVFPKLSNSLIGVMFVISSIKKTEDICDWKIKLRGDFTSPFLGPYIFTLIGSSKSLLPGLPGKLSISIHVAFG